MVCRYIQLKELANNIFNSNNYLKVLLKLTKKVREHLVEKFFYYCKILQLKKRPDLCIDVIEGTGTNRGNDETLDGGYALGLDLIFIVPSRVNNMIQLEETLVHELVHYKYPKMKHGKKFDDTVYYLITMKDDDIFGFKKNKKRKVTIL